MARLGLGMAWGVLAWVAAGAASVLGCGEPQLIVPDVMTVVALLPAHGSVDIGTDVQPLVYLSHPAADRAVAEGAFSLECVGTPTDDSCAEPSAAGCPAREVPAQKSYDAAGQTVRLAPSAALLADTCYVLIVAEGLEAEGADVGPLPVDVRSSFRTH